MWSLPIAACGYMVLVVSQRRPGSIISSWLYGTEHFPHFLLGVKEDENKRL
jgi:hypothetical protein